MLLLGAVLVYVLHEKVYLSVIADLVDLHPYLLTSLQHSGNVVDPFIADIAYVNETVGSWHDLHECSECLYAHNGTLVDFAYLGGSNEAVYQLKSVVGLLAVVGENGNRTVVVDVDLGA